MAEPKTKYFDDFAKAAWTAGMAYGVTRALTEPKGFTTVDQVGKDREEAYLMWRRWWANGEYDVVETVDGLEARLGMQDLPCGVEGRVLDSEGPLLHCVLEDDHGGDHQTWIGGRGHILVVDTVTAPRITVYDGTGVYTGPVLYWHADGRVCRRLADPVQDGSWPEWWHTRIDERGSTASGCGREHPEPEQRQPTAEAAGLPKDKECGVQAGTTYAYCALIKNHPGMHFDGGGHRWTTR